MNRTALITLSLVVAVVLGVLMGRAWQSDTDNAETASSSTEREILYWKAPMDPGYRRDEPGKSPMGMDLVPVYAGEEGEDDPSVVSISPTIVNNLGVRTAAVERSALSRRVETVGYVGYDEDTLQHIHTRVDGWIEKLGIKATGDPVRRGQLLFELYSPTLVNAQEEYLAALNSQNNTLLNASRQRLGALGVTASEIKRLDRERTAHRLISVFADEDGYAAELSVREGIYITPATEIMSIARFDQVWVLAEVFERQAAWIQVGQQAEVELDYVPGQGWQGRVDYIYPELDAKTRTLKVRLRFDNTSRALRPNMFARISIFGSETTPVVHVPREALIRGGAVDRVVLALGGGRFRVQPVDIGIESGDRVEIRMGINEGDLVVTSGQFLIDSESNIEMALARMDENAGKQLPNRVQIGAVVRGVDVTTPNVTLQHDPVPEWSWPAMTMSFEIADSSLLSGLQEGQPVNVEIERLADGRHRITEIEQLPEMPAETGDKPASPVEMDHSNHQMPIETEDPPVAPTEMEHGGHDMPGANDATDDIDHDMDTMQ
jgi:Cu(I)/Ag(I) efflux system membrane fusion protein